MPFSRRIVALLAASAAFAVCAAVPWTPDVKIRCACGIVAAMLLLWISDAAPLGVAALIVPVAASLCGILTWPQAISCWGDSIIFLFLGAFLLARALEKHGAFDWLLRMRWSGSGRSGGALILFVLLIAGVISTVQNNTAVAAMLLPAVVVLARKSSLPAALLLALSYGATFGGMATPVGTAPNFIGYAAMREIDAGVNFVSWMAVGIPVWLGTTMIGWAALWISGHFRANKGAVALPNLPEGVADRGTAAHAAGKPEQSTIEQAREVLLDSRRFARIVSVVAFVAVAVVWLSVGGIKSALPGTHAAYLWVERFLPDALPPIVAAWLLFLIPVRAWNKNEAVAPVAVLDRADFLSIDWDTLFLIAGGLCLGKTLESSGAALALARTVASMQLSPLLLMLALGGATVLLSELTSNTATATLMVPIAKALAVEMGLPPVQAIWLVALCASLGFALPVSTPPNAIVYGTRLVPLRFMAGVGVVVDIACLLWVVLCLRLLG